MRKTLWVALGIFLLALAMLALEVPLNLPLWQVITGGGLIGLANIAFDRGV